MSEYCTKSCISLSVWTIVSHAFWVIRGISVWVCCQQVSFIILPFLQISLEMDSSFQQVLPAVVSIATSLREVTRRRQPQAISVRVPLLVQEWCLAPFNRMRGWILMRQSQTEGPMDLQSRYCTAPCKHAGSVNLLDLAKEMSNIYCWYLSFQNHLKFSSSNAS